MSEAKTKYAGSLVRRPLLAAALAASALAPAPAMAAIFMNLDGVEGEVTAKGYEKWIELHSFQVGFDGGAVKRNGVGNASTGRPACSEVTVTKTLDKTGPGFITATMTGRHFQKAQIDFTRTSDEGTQTRFYKWEMQDVIATGYSESSGGDRPSESLSLNFAKVTVTYYPQSEKGGVPPTPTTSTVNCF